MLRLSKVLEFDIHDSLLLGKKDYVLKAVKEDGMRLQYASKELKADREIVFEAVKEDGRALEFASDELISDDEIGMVAFEEILISADKSYRKRDGYWITTNTENEHRNTESEIWQEYLPSRLILNEGFSNLVCKFINEVRVK